MRTKILSTITLAAFVAITLLNPLSANAVSGSDFQAGRIIDDSLFYDGNTMTAAEIQTFLNSKVPVCDTLHAETTNPRDSKQPYTCLKDYRQDVNNTSVIDINCNGMTAGSKSAAEIIYEAGVSCGISQKVLLALLQRESSLVTDTWPWTIQYETAMGYACPETYVCNTEYSGLASQVYSAARQFKRYERTPGFYAYQANRTANIQYNPNTACGSSEVFIQNNATAGLYNYSPYQPNAASLNNLYGTGDMCSSYSNRNFWRIYNDWFGPTLDIKPTFEYLQTYLKQSAEESGVKLANIQGTLNQIKQSEKLFNAGSTADAEELIKKTISSVNKLAEKDKLKTVNAENYQRFANKLIESWKPAPEPDPQPPVLHGGYPAVWADAPKETIIDPWGQYNRTSGSYAAFKVSTSDRAMPYMGGMNPNQWDDYARSRGIPVDAVPRKGDVLIVNSGIYGFAMFVDEVNADGTLKVSHYDQDLLGNYREQVIAPNSGFVYIHF